MSDIILSPGMMNNQTWSMSKLKMLESCPLNFYLSYILKLRYIDESQDTTARDLGLAIHHTFEMMQSGMTISEAVADTEIKHRHIVTEENWPEYMGMISKVRKFNRIMHDLDYNNPFDYVDAEKKMAINKDFEPVEFFSSDAYFRGIIDYSARRGDKGFVLDFKKGGRGYLTKYHTPQLNSYLLMDYYCNGAYEEAQSYIYYVEAGELSHGPKLRGEVIETHTRPWLVNKIETAVQNVYDKGYFAHQRGNMCKYCNYQNLCKDGTRGTCGSLAKYSIDSKEIL